MTPSRVPDQATPGNRLAARFLRISAIWLFVGVLLGTYMGVTHDHVDKQIHVHGNLLGWASCALFAAFHRLWPSASESMAGRLHFWLHNIGLLSLVAGLALVARGNATAAPLLGAGSLLLVAACAVFLDVVWRATGHAN
ncbi:cytochrome-c oxidase [Ramlibacter terrae]|uniref:Cytochrome-c oxidase n=1 Tax=Ramlibacter terrae TaxID=2732511 RepID=A0ABX6P5H3_9BURK|nr:cytochrome-c oxidase [Ramlibacter terrae]